MRYLFVHSPLLGPGSWRPVATLVEGLVPDVRRFAAAEPPLWRAFVERAVSGGRSGGDLVVVGHSGAGAMLPAIADSVSAAATIFVDAVLPPASGFYTTPPKLRELIASHADGELLRPWTEWWDDDVLERNLPAESTRDEIKRELPQVPLVFYDEAIPVSEGWSDGRCGYVQLSAAYRQETEAALERKWPVARLDIGHLATVTSPDRVADAVTEMARLMLG